MSPDVQAILEAWFTAIHDMPDKRAAALEQRNKIIDEVIRANPDRQLSRLDLLHALNDRFHEFERAKRREIIATLPKRA